MSPRPTIGAPIALHPPRKGTRENRALLPAAIHALIAAALARLFDRLEQLLLLWRSGALIPPPPRPPAQCRTSTTATRPDSVRHHRTQRRQRPRARPAKNPLAPLPSPSWCLRVEIPYLIRHTKPIPAPSARAPPTAKPLTNAIRRHSIRTLKLFR